MFNRLGGTRGVDLDMHTSQVRNDCHNDYNNTGSCALNSNEGRSGIEIEKTKRILVAEDHEAIAATYKLFLESEIGCEVIIARDGQECIETYNEYLHNSRDSNTPYDLVVLDYHLPYKDGIEVAKHILFMNPHQRILIASSYPRDIIVRAAEMLNKRIEYMLKPFELEDFVHTVEGRKDAEIIEGSKRKESMPYCYSS